MKEKRFRIQNPERLVHLLILVYGALCLWLFYNQSIAVLPETGNGRFQSDLPLHLSMVLEDGWYYSFTAIVYQVLDVMFFHSTWGVAIFLCVVAVATVYATDVLLGEFGFGNAGFRRLLLAFSLNFVMPIYVEWVGEFRYVSYQSGNIWHNSTYLCMRLVAVWSLIWYFRLERQYREGLTGKQWLGFALINVLCTGIKPSFLLVYSPIVGIFLLIDLIQGVPFKRVLLFGSALLPSGLVILWQNAVLFGKDTGSKIELALWKNFSQHTQIPKVAVSLSVLFCFLALLYGLIIFIRNRGKVAEKDNTQGRRRVFVLLMTVLGFLEALLFSESGYRASAGNFLWGYYFCIFVLFAVSATIWLRPAKGTFENVSKWILGVVYGLHLYCGLYFFALLVSGVGYFT